MCERTVHLLFKNSDTKDPKHYRSITCLSRTYKLLTSVLTDRLHLPLQQSDLFPLEQKECRPYSYDCKNQRMINKMLLRELLREKEMKFDLCMDLL